jgi:hypothetical protein
LIAYQDAIKWLNDNKLIGFKTGKLEAKDISFEQSGDYKGAQKSQVQYLKLN